MTESIADNADDCKPVEIIQGALGTVIKGQKDNWYGVLPPKRSRGDIKGFSSASRRRLRERLALASHVSGKTSMLGGCLTIPGDVLPPENVRKIWHDFVKAWKYKTPDIPFVWRIELQTRKQPHWHVVVYAPFERAKEAEENLYRLWGKVISSNIDFGTLEIKTISGFGRYGVNTKCLDDSQAANIIGYLADHTSKHKQDQLGWRGRQWGIVNKAYLRENARTVATISPDTQKRAARQYRRLQAHLRKDKKYTGCKVMPSSKTSSTVFGRDEQRYLQIVDYLQRVEQLELQLPTASNKPANIEPPEKQKED